MTALERYRRYLDALDREAVLVADQDEYLDLLTMPEVVDVLCLRDEIDGLRLDSSQGRSWHVLIISCSNTTVFLRKTRQG